MAILKVIKPFVFSHPDGRTRAFVRGVHTVDDEIANHPWIRDHRADGRIEAPEVVPEPKPKKGG